MSPSVAIACAATVLGSGGADARKGDAGGGKTGIWMGLRTQGHVVRAGEFAVEKTASVPKTDAAVGLRTTSARHAFAGAVRFLVLERSCTAGCGSGSACAWSLTGSIWLHAGAPMAAPRRQRKIESASERDTAVPCTVARRIQATESASGERPHWGGAGGRVDRRIRGSGDCSSARANVRVEE